MIGEDIRQEAADWVIRSDIPGFPDRAMFEVWRDADPRHAAAFERAKALWNELEHIPIASPSRVEDSHPRQDRPARNLRPRRMVVGAIAASLAAMVGIGMSDEFLILLQSDLRTSVGMHLDRKLPDGSNIELDDSSAVALDFTDTERRLKLLKGQVFVDVAPVGSDERRPFIIEAANGETRALGTSFNINRVGATVNVTAVTHRIMVTTTGPAAPSRKPVLSPGQELRYGPDGGVALRVSSPALATAWRHDRLILDRVTLAEASTILRRYSDAPIRLLDDKSDVLRVSGVFDAHDTEGTLRLIADEHNLRLVKVPLLGFFLS